MKLLVVNMPNGYKYSIPADVIADNRAKYYAKLDSVQDGVDYDTIYKKEFDYTVNDESELIDWASNNLNWADVKDHASIKDKLEIVWDMEDGWMNGEKHIIEN